MNKVFIAILFAAVCTLSTYSLASADVGELQECFVSSTHSDYAGGGSTTFETAQTFQAGESYTISAVKVGLYQNVTNTPGNINISLRGTTLSGGQLKPNSTIHAATVIAGTTLPLAPSGSFSCTATTLPTQLIEFATPIALVSGTTYAIVVQREDSVNPGLTTFHLSGSNVDEYGVGIGFTNGTAFNENTPADWLDNANDFDFATYDNIITSTPARDINSWLTNFLESLGMNSTGGKLFIGSGFALILLLTLLLLKVPFLLALGFGGIITIVLVSALLISQAAFLAMLSLAGIAIVGRLILGSGGEATD